MARRAGCGGSGARIDRGFRGSARGTAVPLSHPCIARKRYTRKPRETCGRSRSRKYGSRTFSIGIPVTLAKHRGPIDPVRSTPPEGDVERERSHLVAGRLSMPPENPEAGFRTRVSPATSCDDAETSPGRLTQRPVSDLPAGTGNPLRSGNAKTRRSWRTRHRPLTKLEGPARRLSLRPWPRFAETNRGRVAVVRTILPTWTEPLSPAFPPRPERPDPVAGSAAKPEGPASCRRRNLSSQQISVPRNEEPGNDRCRSANVMPNRAETHFDNTPSRNRTRRSDPFRVRPALSAAHTRSEEPVMTGRRTYRRRRPDRADRRFE